MITASRPVANLLDIRTQIFSTKLAAILDEPRFSHILSWMPHGRAWRILSPHKFEDEVAPHYFEYPNYHSFQRLVNAWGFRRIKNGRDVNAYYHEVSNIFGEILVYCESLHASVNKRTAIKTKCISVSSLIKNLTILDLFFQNSSF